MYEGTPSAWLNVATSQAMAGEFERADEAFARMQELHDVEHGAKEGKRLFMPMQTANYLTALDRAGRPDLAMPYLERLADFYCSLHVTDSTFLHMRQMPFFHMFLENALPIVRKLKSDDELRAWYCAIYDRVDDEGKRMFGACGIPH